MQHLPWFPLVPPVPAPRACYCFSTVPVPVFCTITPLTSGNVPASFPSAQFLAWWTQLSLLPLALSCCFSAWLQDLSDFCHLTALAVKVPRISSGPALPGVFASHFLAQMLCANLWDDPSRAFSILTPSQPVNMVCPRLLIFKCCHIKLSSTPPPVAVPSSTQHPAASFSVWGIVHKQQIDFWESFSWNYHNNKDSHLKQAKNAEFLGWFLICNLNCSEQEFVAGTRCLAL